MKIRASRPTVFLLLIPLLFLLVCEVPLTAQQRTAEKPAWVLYQVAERHFRQREFARALEMYGEALAVQPLFPEAMVGMARVHRAAGDITLARRYYLGALEAAVHMTIPDEEYAVRLELARLLALSGTDDHRRLQREQLENVVARDPVFSRTENSLHRDAMRELLYRSGLDRVLVLYRLDFPQAREAHHRMGELLLESRDPADVDLAIEHFLFAVVESAGRAINTIIEIHFDFEFSTMEEFLAMAEQYPEVRQYLRTVDFFEALSGLADALEKSDHPAAPDRAAELRRVLLSR